MDDLTFFRSLIIDKIREYAQYPPSVGEIATEVVIDETNDHYELVQSGWVGRRRVEGAVLHIDIRGGKIWIQHDGTEEGIADTFAAAGVPRDKIVLAFKPPEVRPYTGFAVA